MMWHYTGIAADLDIADFDEFIDIADFDEFNETDIADFDEWMYVYTLNLY